LAQALHDERLFVFEKMNAAILFCKSLCPSFTEMKKG